MHCLKLAKQNMPIAEIKKKFGIFRDMPSINSSNVALFAKKIENFSSSLKNTPTIISHDLKVEGRITGQGIIEIEGSVSGDLYGKIIIIRESGFVEGQIFADSINIRGKFKGTIAAKIVSISSKANFNGKIEYQTLSVEDGASIDGEFKRISEFKKKTF